MPAPAVQPAYAARFSLVIRNQKHVSESEPDMQTGVSKDCSRLPVVLMIIALCLSPVVQAQNSPLQLFKDYFVTGDYVVGGVGLRGLGDSSGYATKTINIPDSGNGPNGVSQPNATAVPAGADVVAAFLYWQTVESSQSNFAGQQGFFNQIAIKGDILGNPNAPVSWSSGGCVGASNGAKTLRTYRADVRPYLNQDSNGEVVGNGSYEVRLADSGSNGGGAPLTLGATLVIVYRVLSPTVPLNAVILYDGAFAPNNSSQVFTQGLAGIYQASASPKTKITHIAGNGQLNKFESVALNTTNLPSLYGPSQPPFPGFYNGSWDSPTWIANGAVGEDLSSATTTVTPSSSNTGCVVWGAVVLSTTVKDGDKDGLLDKWEDDKGYNDVNSGQFVALPGADKNVKDLFVEVDYLKNLDGSAGSSIHSHLPKQEALDKVGVAFKNAPVDCNAQGCKGIQVHFDVGNVYQSPMPKPGAPSKNCGTQANPVLCDPYIISNPPGSGGNAIPETALLCNDVGGTLCAFPGIPTVGWKGGLVYVKNNATVPNSSVPLGNFQLGRAPSYHYLFFGHALGASRSYWGAAGTSTTTNSGKLVSIVVNNNVGAVTLQSVATGFLKPGDAVGPNDPASLDTNLDRVTVEGALAQTNLNGSYQFSSLNTSTDNSGIATTTFTIPTTNVANGTYTAANERWLGVAYGGPTSSSGHSDLGGGDSLVTFGLWPADDPAGCQPNPAVLTGSQTYCDNQVGSVQSQAGTLMHELGHPLTLTHGGAYYANANNNPSSAPTYGLNCKPNFLSVMNYLFQIRGFPDKAIDYSQQTLAELGEGSLNESTGLGSSPTATHPTRWFAPLSPLDIQLGDRAAMAHCDGSPIIDGAQMVRVDGTTLSSPIDWNNDFIVPNAVAAQDVNFDGTTGGATLPGFNDWAVIDLRQTGARQNAFGFSGSGSADIRGGSADIRGGSADIRGGSADIRGGVEVDFRVANSTVDSPSSLNATWNKSTKAVDLTWVSPVFGQIRTYNIYRLLGVYNPTTNPLTKAVLVKALQGTPSDTPPPTKYSDTTAKTNVTYTYFVTAALGDKRQSGPTIPPAQVTTK